jgi:hypothetical protein
MLPALFHCRRLSTVTVSNNVTECVIRVIGRSVMGQILELRRGRHYGTVLVTNVNKTSAATNNQLDD